jgi:hypothetical protein
MARAEFLGEKYPGRRKALLKQWGELNQARDYDIFA